MTDPPVELDEHRGMAAQKATELRREKSGVQAEQDALRQRRATTLEAQLLMAPATTWPEAATKARFLIELFAATVDAQDARHKELIARVLADFDRLSR